jgi:hypothetical protein
MDGLVCSLESNVSRPPEVESALRHNLNSASQSHDKGTAVPSLFKITSKYSRHFLSTWGLRVAVRSRKGNRNAHISRFPRPSFYETHWRQKSSLLEDGSTKSNFRNQKFPNVQ